MGKELWVKFDVREGPTASSAQMCATAIEQSVWAEENGFAAVLFGEHHGTEDGYNPSPIVLAAAVAARTKRIRLQLGAILLPLHDPLRIAEDLCILDNISNGRVDVTIGVGYVPSEFDMFGLDLKQRAPLVDEGIKVLKDAFSGEFFTYRGRKVRVSPRPVQQGGPELMIGGSLKATALRAARLGDGLFPTVSTPELQKLYREECKRLGRPVGRIIDMTGPASIHVSHDPERDWPRVSPGMMHEMNVYGKWARESGAKIPSYEVKDVDSLKATGLYHVFTPDDCLALLNKQRDAGRHTMFNPLCGGLHPDIAWESLELLASEVLPRFQHKNKEN